MISPLTIKKRQVKHVPVYFKENRILDFVVFAVYRSVIADQMRHQVEIFISLTQF